MVREVVKFGARVLRDRCAPVQQVGDDTRALVRDLFDSMHAADGVGLAAPQIGERLRIIAVDVSHQEPQYAPVALINPEITAVSGTQVGEEGCLSFPDLYADVKRAEQVQVRALDPEGKKVEITADGFFARALQHEIDHLDGKLFVDRVSPLKRQLMRGSLRRLKKMGEAWDKEQRSG
jgi:peptide deformylase